MKVQELRKLDGAALAEKLKEVEHTLFKLKMQLAQGSLPKNHMVRATRRQLATIKTLMTEKAKG